MKCAEYERLQAEVASVLERLSELTRTQLKAFENNDMATFRRLDRELENIVGEKERTIGALRQHVSEHQCQPGLVA